MAYRTVMMLLAPSVVGDASDGTILENWCIFLHILVSSPRFMLSLICLTGLSGILIKQCSEAAYYIENEIRVYSYVEFSSSNIINKGKV